MKHTLIAAALVTLLSTATYGFAQSASTPPSGSQATRGDNNSASAGNDQEAMKQCMARQKASNSGLTNVQMQTTCKNEIKGDKMHKEGNDLATGPQSGEKPPQQ